MHVTLSLVTRFINQDFSLPVYHQCGNYFGNIDQVAIQFKCTNGHELGQLGYGVHVQFFGEMSPTLSICQMDILLADSKYNSYSDGF